MNIVYIMMLMVMVVVVFVVVGVEMGGVGWCCVVWKIRMD